MLHICALNLIQCKASTAKSVPSKDTFSFFHQQIAAHPRSRLTSSQAAPRQISEWPASKAGSIIYVTAKDKEMPCLMIPWDLTMEGHWMY